MAPPLGRVNGDVRHLESEALVKVAKLIGWVLYVLWAISTGWELYTRESGEPISIVGQMYFNVGIPFLALFLVLFWFMKRTGLDKLPMYMERFDSHLKSLRPTAGEDRRPPVTTSSSRAAGSEISDA